MRKIITLLTDFGVTDSYAAQMKGVILGICPDATIVDITHSIEPYDIMHAAVTLAQTYAYFPPGTVHTAVVDPGVGSKRRGIVVAAGLTQGVAPPLKGVAPPLKGIVSPLKGVAPPGHVFVGPDNGIFSLIYKELKDFAVYNITNEKLFFKRPGATFHGRDVFAPVAARICAGMAPSEAGEEIIDAGSGAATASGSRSPGDCVRLDIPDPIIHIDAGDRIPIEGDRIPIDAGGRGRIEGIVLYLDRFGNATTNVEETLPPKNIDAGGGLNDPHVVCKGRRGDFKNCYAEGAHGELCALIGSSGRVELFVNQGSVKDAFGIKTGDKIEIFF
jgi:hypothetical protein